jgi:hypothetical protein
MDYLSLMGVRYPVGEFVMKKIFFLSSIVSFFSIKHQFSQRLYPSFAYKILGLPGIHFKTYLFYLIATFSAD